MTEELSADEHFLRLLGGKWITAAISAAARLGIAEVLHDDDGAPRALDAAAIARQVACEPAGLERLLRVLAAEGLLAVDETDRFTLTPLGAPLRRDALGELAALVGQPFMWDPWSALPDALRTGETGFERIFGRSLFAHLDAEDADRAAWHRGVDAFTRHEARALARNHDFGPVRAVVDVGGGLGTVCAELAAAWPHLALTLIERPPVAARAAARFAALGLDRCRAVAGSFFDPLPAGADRYVVKHVIHNWDDDAAVAILTRCAEAMAPGGRVLVVEGILLPGTRRDATRLLDLEMLVLRGAGRERDKKQFKRLFAAAGLLLETTAPLAGSARLLIGRRR